MAALSDESLLAGCARGDELCLAALYDRHGRAAYALGYRILKSSALAEEAVQDGFLSAWRTAGRFDPRRASAATWLMTMVRRRAIDLVRREETRRADRLGEGDLAVEPDATPLQVERLALRDALAELPEREREVIALAYFGGFTQTEIAERLRQPLGTVKTRTWNGLARLRATLVAAG